MSQPTTRARRTRQSPVPQVVLTEAQRLGVMPLDYLLGVMRDETAAPARRDAAAKCAAQYCHPRAADIRQTKKAVQAKAAATAGRGSVWGSDLDVDDGLLSQ
jgi:hypothetical protein